MSRSLLLSLLTYGLLLAGIVTVQGAFLALALPLVTYLLIGYLQAPETIKLEATRHLSAERTSPNSDVEVTVTLTNRGSNLEEILLEDDLPFGLTIRSGPSSPLRMSSSPLTTVPVFFGRTNRHLLRLAKGGTYTFAYTVSGPRGGYVFDGLGVQVNDHLAVSRSKVRVEAKGRLFILPPVTRVRNIAIRPRRTRVYAGTIPARAGGTGTEFFGVREYQPGDPPHSINWRASARYSDTLYANEYQQERVADVGIVLDGRLRTNQFGRGHALFEYSVQAAASLADALLNQGNRVGLLLYASFLGWTFPGYGKIQRERILHALANAKTGESQVFSDLEHIPTRLFPPESQLIFVSPLMEDDLKPLVRLRAQGYDVLVVSPNPVRFELSYLPSSDPGVELAGRIIHMERLLLLQRLQRANIHVLDWDVKEPFDLFVKRRLGRSPAWLRAIGR
ncbi:MAG: DUF58 domain-containing protein [Chloroflexi bacterium]|nr:MAG: DUF58 domain-containing protein [Chloroflexota bacterium]